MSPRLRAWGLRGLIWANVLVLVVLFGFACDWVVRWRVGQGISQYHNQVIVPMTTPRPPAAGK